MHMLPRVMMKYWRGVGFVLIIAKNKRRWGTNMTINGDGVVQIVVPSMTGRHFSSYDLQDSLPNWR